MNAITPRGQALVNARRVLDQARARRDALSIRQAAEQAAVGSFRTADEIELILRRLHRAAGNDRRPVPANPAAAAA
ncbi:hypothetical protein [Streptomyces sp. RKAG293]|uniref:hypothetical protein n=1 Tax=Streptomyces sp. RKAG293 TaxID=2893403 RepID=UPI002034564A|nr:hypothetical protein [Streptomyces sp. RKAG293]MCM2420278.1 hypothetical protein [Streptomyces sp. RKAG293]